MSAWDGSDLVGDGYDGVEPLLAGDVEVTLELVPGDRVRARLDLDECSPSFGPAAGADEAIGEHAPFLEVERHLDECLQAAGGRAEGGGHNAAEFLHGAHHGEQS